MKKSELIESMGRKFQLPAKDVELAVNVLLEHMGEALTTGGRIEIRGFGAFSVRFRPGRMARNPGTGEVFPVEGKYWVHFRPGKELQDRVNARHIDSEAEPGT
jgi:integration host factor subunit beta